jgi:diadenosine tetraphosphatase ApaH/serine/threonine PP2A family protein phosphatase
MRAILYDVHGNLPALEAVLAETEAAGVSSYVLGGDYVMAGAWPRETLDRLRTLEAEWIRGNTERWLADDHDAPPEVAPLIEFSAQAIGDDDVRRLSSLDGELVLDGAHFCHASPGSDMVPLLPEPADDEEELLAGARERRLVFGHTHLQFQRESAGGIELTNPGSVGAPFDEDHRAAYALWHDDGRIERKRTPYDWQRSVAAIRERLGDAGETPARRLERASFQG